MEERDKVEQSLTDALMDQLDIFRSDSGVSEASRGADEAVVHCLTGSAKARTKLGEWKRHWNGANFSDTCIASHHADTENIVCVSEDAFAELLQKVASEKKGWVLCILFFLNLSFNALCHYYHDIIANIRASCASA